MQALVLKECAKLVAFVSSGYAAYQTYDSWLAAVVFGLMGSAVASIVWLLCVREGVARNRI